MVGTSEGIFDGRPVRVLFDSSLMVTHAHDRSLAYRAILSAHYQGEWFTTDVVPEYDDTHAEGVQLTIGLDWIGCLRAVLSNDEPFPCATFDKTLTRAMLPNPDCQLDTRKQKERGDDFPGKQTALDEPSIQSDYVGGPHPHSIPQQVDVWDDIDPLDEQFGLGIPLVPHPSLSLFALVREMQRCAYPISADTIRALEISLLLAERRYQACLPTNAVASSSKVELY